MPPQCKTARFPIRHWSFTVSVEFWIRGYYTIHVGFGMQVSNTPTYPARADFHFLMYSVALSQSTNRQTDRRTSCS